MLCLCCQKQQFITQNMDILCNKLLFETETYILCELDINTSGWLVSNVSGETPPLRLIGLQVSLNCNHKF